METDVKGMMEKLKNMSLYKKLEPLIEVIQSNWQRADVTSRAGELAYFSLLSLFPLILAAANIIPFLPISAGDILPYLKTALPPDIYNLLGPVLESYLSNTHGGILSIGLVTSLWSASKFFNILQDVMNEVYGVEEKENFILVRVVSLLVELAIVAVVGVVLFIFIFGQQIVQFVESLLHINLNFILQLLQLRWIILFILLILLFGLIYILLPDHHLSWKYAVPGAIFATVGWLVLSQGFSLYVSLAGGEAAGNATFGAFIVLMLWLYLSAIVVLLGGLLNSIVYEYRNHQTVAEHEIMLEEEKKDPHEKDPYQGRKKKKQRQKIRKVKTVAEQKES